MCISFLPVILISIILKTCQLTRNKLYKNKNQHLREKKYYCLCSFITGIMNPAMNDEINSADRSLTLQRAAPWAEQKAF